MEEIEGCQQSSREDVVPETNMTRYKRKIIKPQRDYDPQKGTWTTEEKSRFLKALKKHGCLNITAIQREVQTKSEESIKLFISHCSKNARYLMEKRSDAYSKKNKSFAVCCKHKKIKSAVTDEAIDQWLQRFHAAEPPGYTEIKALPIARAFLYISKFEEHPDPKSCKGVDFKSLYETLYYMFCGLPGKQLNKETVEFFNKTIDQLSKLVMTSPMAERSDVLRNVARINYPPSGRVRKYPGKKQMQASHEQEDFLLELQGYNPLRLPRHYLSFNETLEETPPPESRAEVKMESVEIPACSIFS
ncbi:uncharacterized protein LOC124804994 isoform X1 [Schistocerca piceifrons]|uniref:uncharacterized protein LOC124804994 isoform X1 n=2 Tax=Schistocerca piceifrons TaxID=274613 RepID=UPI001F5EE848|nr:uncharacterized protein LOC124804994 isoform X1 [Schistocerca piceifrons]